MTRLTHPITNVLAALLTALDAVTGNMGLAIILLTIIIRVVLHPLSRVSLKSMKKMQALAPQMGVLRRKYKDDPKQANIEVMNLMRSEGVNPLGGCLPVFIQFPVLIALFNLLRPGKIIPTGTGPGLERIPPGLLEGKTFLGIQLSVIPSFEKIIQNPVLLIFPILVGATTYFQSRLSMTDPQQAKLFIFMPFFIAYTATLFPVGMSIYWIVSTLTYILEYYIIVRRPVRPSPALARPPDSSRGRPNEGGGGSV